MCLTPLPCLSCCPCPLAHWSTGQLCLPPANRQPLTPNRSRIPFAPVGTSVPLVRFSLPGQLVNRSTGQLRIDLTANRQPLTAARGQGQRHVPDPVAVPLLLPLPTCPLVNRSTLPPSGQPPTANPQPLANTIRAGRDQRPAGPLLSPRPTGQPINGSTPHRSNR